MGMKGSYLGFGSPQQQVYMHIRSKTLSLSYNMHLFLPYLLNDSQTIRSMFHFSKPLLCETLICGDWSHFHLILPVIPDKAAFVSAVLLCVQRYRGNHYFTTPKAAPSGKEWICIFIQTYCEKTNKWAGNMLMFHVDVNLKWLGISFKNNSFQWFRVNSFFWETMDCIRNRPYSLIHYSLH